MFYISSFIYITQYHKSQSASRNVIWCTDCSTSYDALDSDGEKLPKKPILWGRVAALLPVPAHCWCEPLLSLLLQRMSQLAATQYFGWDQRWRQGCILKSLIIRLLHLTNNLFKACHLCLKTGANLVWSTEEIILTHYTDFNIRYFQCRTKYTS